MAKKCNENPHKFILDEILNGERLGCDPSKVSVAAGEDPESDEDDKDWLGNSAVHPPKMCVERANIFSESHFCEENTQQGL